jgi:NitT/TauT family transport system substrate-binding protein
LPLFFPFLPIYRASISFFISTPLTFHRIRETFSPNGMMPDDAPAVALRALTLAYPELAATKVDLARTFSNDWVRKARQKFNV